MENQRRFNQVIAIIKGFRIRNLFAFLIIIAAIPLTVFVAQQQQDTRQRASCSPICGTKNVCDEETRPVMEQVCDDIDVGCVAYYPDVCDSRRVCTTTVRCDDENRLETCREVDTDDCHYERFNCRAGGCSKTARSPVNCVWRDSGRTEVLRINCRDVPDESTCRPNPSCESRAEPSPTSIPVLTSIPTQPPATVSSAPPSSTATPTSAPAFASCVGGITCTGTVTGVHAQIVCSPGGWSYQCINGTWTRMTNSPCVCPATSTPTTTVATPTPTTTTVTPLLAPGSLIASCISATSVRLSWNQVSGAGAYQLRINKLNNGGSSAWEPGQNGDSTPVAQGGSTTSHTMSVDAGAQYHWTIQAVKPNESYPFSGQSSDGGYFTCSAGGGGPGA